VFGVNPHGYFTIFLSKKYLISLPTHPKVSAYSQLHGLLTMWYGFLDPKYHIILALYCRSNWTTRNRGIIAQIWIDLGVLSFK
jgi:hypothetical protein